jgi:hypothetical protein
MFLPGDRFKIYYDDWLVKIHPEGFRHPKVGSYHKVWIEVFRLYLDTAGDYAYVCRRCDCKEVDSERSDREFVVRLSELAFK